MKVVHLCQSSNPDIGGSLVVARALASAQCRLEIDARLFYLYQSQHDKQNASESATVCLGIHRSQRYSLGMLRLYGALRHANPDVIHHHDGLLWPRLVTARLGVPLVTHGHLGAPIRRRKYFSHLTHRYIAVHTDRLIAISKWVSASWASAGFSGDKIRLVGNGVDTLRFRKSTGEERREALQSIGIDSSRQILLWAGRLDRKTKGLDRLLTVAEQLPEDWCFLVAGDGADREWLTRELDVRQLRRNDIILLGKVADPERWFGAADAYLFTSQREPFGLVILEAAASELPIIAYRCEGGGMAILEELGVRVLEDDEQIDFLSLSGRDEAARNRELIKDRYSWEAAAAKTFDVYRELVSNRTVPLRQSH